MVDEERLFKPPIEHQNHGAKPFILFKSPIFNENRKKYKNSRRSSGCFKPIWMYSHKRINKMYLGIIRFFKELEVF